jgi:hypothetical protein
MMGMALIGWEPERIGLVYCIGGDGLSMAMMRAAVIGQDWFIGLDRH